MFGVPPSCGSHAPPPLRIFPSVFLSFRFPNLPRVLQTCSPTWDTVRITYNILFTICFWLASPYYFLRMLRRGDWQRGFGERFGKFDARVKQSLSNRHVLWMHAVSVGEVNICTQTIRALEPRLPNAKIMVSTTTSTGMGEMLKRLPQHVGKFYYPVDRRKCVSRSVSVVNPDAVILVEAEIWPNFIWRMKDRATPMFLVNARLSEKSYRGYKRFGFLFRDLFASFTAVGAQSEADAARWIEVGCRPEAVHILGNLKFDVAATETRRTLNVRGMLQKLGVPDSAKLLVCGSTHAGEEFLLAQMYQRLRKQFPDLFLVLVPRHHERSRDVARSLRACGVHFVQRSEIGTETHHAPGSVDCLLVNSTGELRFFYEHASLVFVGKSLTAKGGQNPIEACALGKPVLFGPNMQNFADVVRLILEGDGARQVADAAELEKAIGELLTSPARCEQLGKNALRVVLNNQGATKRTVDLILKHLDGQELYIAGNI